MPHRLLELQSSFLTITEGVLLGILTAYQFGKTLVLAFTDQDWSRFMGPQGFTVGLLLAVVVLWGNGVVSERNRQTRADRTEQKNDERHAENRQDIKALTESLTALSAEAIRAQVKSAIVQIENTQCVKDLSEKVAEMNSLLAVSPCLVAHQIRKPIPIPPTHESDATDRS